MSDQIMQIAMRIKELREIYDYSPKDLAHELNISVEEYKEYEEGKKDIPRQRPLWHI